MHYLLRNCLKILNSQTIFIRLFTLVADHTILLNFTIMKDIYSEVKIDQQESYSHKIFWKKQSM